MHSQDKGCSPIYGRSAGGVFGASPSLKVMAITAYTANSGLCCLVESNSGDLLKILSTKPVDYSVLLAVPGSDSEQNKTTAGGVAVIKKGQTLSLTPCVVLPEDTQAAASSELNSMCMRSYGRIIFSPSLFSTPPLSSDCTSLYTPRKSRLTMRDNSRIDIACAPSMALIICQRLGASMVLASCSTVGNISSEPMKSPLIARDALAAAAWNASLTAITLTVNTLMVLPPQLVYVCMKAGYQIFDGGERGGILPIPNMFMVTFASFVVVAHHANPINDISQAVLVLMVTPQNFRGDLQDSNGGESIFCNLDPRVHQLNCWHLLLPFSDVNHSITHAVMKVVTSTRTENLTEKVPGTQKEKGHTANAALWGDYSCDSSTGNVAGFRRNFTSLTRCTIRKAVIIRLMTLVNDSFIVAPPCCQRSGLLQCLNIKKVASAESNTMKIQVKKYSIFLAHSVGGSFGLLRWRRLISPRNAVTMYCPVLSSDSCVFSIPSITSSGILTVLCCDLLFFVPVAIYMTLCCLGGIQYTGKKNKWKWLTWDSPLIRLCESHQCYHRGGKQRSPAGAATLTGLLTTNDSRSIEAAMQNHTTHPQGRDLLTLNNYTWHSLAPTVRLAPDIGVNAGGYLLLSSLEHSTSLSGFLESISRHIARGSLVTYRSAAIVPLCTAYAPMTRATRSSKRLSVVRVSCIYLRGLLAAKCSNQLDDYFRDNSSCEKGAIYLISPLHSVRLLAFLVLDGGLYNDFSAAEAEKDQTSSLALWGDVDQLSLTLSWPFLAFRCLRLRANFSTPNRIGFSSRSAGAWVGDRLSVMRHSSGVFAFRRWRRLISVLAAATRKPAVLSPSCFDCSIPSITSCGIRTVVICDFAFFAPVAITDTPHARCISVYAKKTIKKGLKCISLKCSVKSIGDIHHVSTSPRSATNTCRGSNHNVNKDYAMTSIHSSTQGIRAPSWQKTYVFAAIRRSDAGIHPVTLRVTAPDEHAARRQYARHFLLVLMARICLEAH